MVALTTLILPMMFQSAHRENSYDLRDLSSSQSEVLREYADTNADGMAPAGSVNLDSAFEGALDELGDVAADLSAQSDPAVGSESSNSQLAAVADDSSFRIGQATYALDLIWNLRGEVSDRDSGAIWQSWAAIIAALIGVVAAFIGGRASRAKGDEKPRDSPPSDPKPTSKRGGTTRIL